MGHQPNHAWVILKIYVESIADNGGEWYILIELNILIRIKKWLYLQKWIFPFFAQYIYMYM